MANTSSALPDVSHHQSSKQFNRDNYVGEKRSHLREGFGVYSYENRFFRYEGQWKHGKKHGHGKLLMKDGSFYEGEFKDGEIVGHGFKYWASTRNTYSGQFHLGELLGTGVMRYSDGSVYEGEWLNNKREGRGKFTDTDGSISEGEYHNHKMHGEGKKWYSDGSQYEGSFINGKRQGSGVLKMADGSVFDGQWSNDIFNGQGKMIHSSGFEYDGIWVNGKPAQVSHRLELVDIPPEGLVVDQDQSFSVQVRTVDEDGEVIEDNGRELTLTAGYKYVPKAVATKDDNASILDTILTEDVEGSLIETPFGYTVLPYPITDEDLSMMSLAHEDTDLTQVSQMDTSKTDTGEPNEAAGEMAVGESKADNEAEASEENPQNTEETPEEIPSHKPVNPVRTVNGACIFKSLHLLPPPPQYKPFQTDDDGSGTPKSKAKNKAPAKTEPKAKSKAGTPAKSGPETICRPGSYVVMITDTTKPPFLGISLPPVFFLITMKKQKRRTSVMPKGPKWDTSKHIQQSIALHREDTFNRETSNLTEEGIN